MLNKESKIRVLENFYSLDYVFYGKPIKKMTSCCPSLVEDYITVKGALMSLVIEMYKLIDHSPEVIDDPIDSRSLTEAARENAKVARENAYMLVHSDKGRADIKAELQESLTEDSDINIEEEVKDKIREKAFSLAIDNILIGRAVHESAQIEVLNDWEGQIVEDAYKVLRDSLVESAMFILEAVELLAD